MCSNLFLRFVNIGFFLTFFSVFFLCMCKVSNKAFLLCARSLTKPLNQAPVPGCRHSSCVLIVHVCLCVCASVCACENV